MVFVERQDQVAGFATTMAACQAGHGRLVAITGPMASGKSTLLGEFVQRAAAAGFVTMQAIGTRAERALPLSVINQLCHELPVPEADRILLVREAHRIAVRHAGGTLVPGQGLPTMLHNVSAALLATSREVPVLIAVDDLHHVDPLSLHCLVYLARRIRTARILMVVTSGELVEPAEPHLHAELLESAAHDHTLPRLSRDGIGEMLAATLGAPPADAMVDACASATGGNPLLARTLMTDLRESGAPALDRDGQVRPGRAYTSAVRRYVDRCDPQIQLVLAAAAVLGERPPAGALTVARLADVDTAATRRALRGLERAGLLVDGCQLRPHARQAVLDHLAPATLTDLHLRAARLLHEEGSTPLPVAEHLLAAGHAPHWAGPLLVEAADRLFTGGDADRGLTLLRLAHDSTTDTRERAALKVALMQAEWRTDPATAGHRLGQLAAAAQDGRLTVEARVTVAHCLLWLGNTAEAIQVIDGLPGPDATADIRFLTVWARYLYPGLLPDEPDGPLVTRRSPESMVSTRHAIAHALETVLIKGPNTAAVTAAEQSLPRAQLGPGTPAALAAALAVLVYADHLETATLWTDRLIAQASELGAPSWQAMLFGVRADIALRAGHLADAQRYAEAALGQMSPASWGPAIAVPLSALIMAALGRGDLEAARRQLDQPVPDAMFRTVWGLSYLQARGHYYLATGRPAAALDDFTTCGDLMARWNLDLPAIVPWRVLTADAHLALEQPERARTLAESQLTQLGAEPSRTKAAALRVLAATVAPVQRPALLRDATTMFRGCGDRLGLAQALADLSRAQRALGDFQRARLTVRKAYDVAGECQADALRKVLLPDVDDNALAVADAGDTEAFHSLSDAERRVAALAAQGSTNRQIATKLYVTVSTVEQHLTKVYRKLNVTRRADLLIKFGALIGDPA
ncbi:helix-turn-helix transcriptional regulator [Actinoplanes sp. CA-252034]|uniref:helix-turn-helix transcriptional regulator n=1 Tax=Actinoplanes sp. CA-252034 TaxID=3239906 RepID=UPI003D9946E9